MRNIRVGYHDTDTGEIVEGVPVFAFRKQSPFRVWAMMNLKAVEELAKAPIPLSAKNVFLYMLSQMGYENRVLLTQVKIARELNTSRPRVCKAVKQLSELGAIAAVEKIGNVTAYEVNQEWAWRGKVTNLNKRRKERFEEMAR